MSQDNHCSLDDLRFKRFTHALRYQQTSLSRRKISISKRVKLATLELRDDYLPLFVDNFLSVSMISIVEKISLGNERESCRLFACREKCQVFEV